MDFDFAKVTEASRDNPVFYVQYAHARIQFNAAQGGGRGHCHPSDAHLDKADRRRGTGPDQAGGPIPANCRISGGSSREPHRVAFYLNDLAAAFHAYYNLGNDRPDRRILMVNDPETTSARLFLVKNIGQTMSQWFGAHGCRGCRSDVGPGHKTGTGRPANIQAVTGLTGSMGMSQDKSSKPGSGR